MRSLAKAIRWKITPFATSTDDTGRPCATVTNRFLGFQLPPEASRTHDAIYNFGRFVPGWRTSSQRLEIVSEIFAEFCVASSPSHHSLPTLPSSVTPRGLGQFLELAAIDRVFAGWDREAVPTSCCSAFTGQLDPTPTKQFKDHVVCTKGKGELPCPAWIDPFDFIDFPPGLRGLRPALPWGSCKRRQHPLPWSRKMPRRSDHQVVRLEEVSFISTPTSPRPWCPHRR